MISASVAPFARFHRITSAFFVATLGGLSGAFFPVLAFLPLSSGWHSLRSVDKTALMCRKIDTSRDAWKLARPALSVR
jgi:hypothetical protein